MGSGKILGVWQNRCLKVDHNKFDTNVMTSIRLRYSRGFVRRVGF